MRSFQRRRREPVKADCHRCSDLWPGMDARSFLVPPPAPSSPIATDAWLSAGARTASGALLLAFGARSVRSPLLAGWLGMIGLALFLHFGSFALLALVWQSFGYGARPLMRKPLLSQSLSELGVPLEYRLQRSLPHRSASPPPTSHHRTSRGVPRLCDLRTHSRVRDLPASRRRLRAPDPLLRHPGRGSGGGAFSIGDAIALRSRLARASLHLRCRSHSHRPAVSSPIRPAGNRPFSPRPPCSLKPFPSFIPPQPAHSSSQLVSFTFAS